MITEIAARYVSTFTRTQPQWRHMRDDLRQEAALGAIHAQRLYKPGKVPFAAFAWGWCRIYVLRYLKAQRQGSEGEKTFDPTESIEDALAIPIARQLVARLAASPRGHGGHSCVSLRYVEAWFAMRFGDASGVDTAAKLGISRQRLYKILALIDRDFDRLRKEITHGPAEQLLH